MQKTGGHRRLALILYEAGSVYDQQVLSDLRDGRTVVAEQDPRIGEVHDGFNSTAAGMTVNFFGPVLPRSGQRYGK